MEKIVGRIKGGGMPMESFKCGYCSCLSTKLLFYSKEYPNGKTTIESPILSCDLCTEKALADLSIVRGGIEGVYIKTFKELGAMSEKKVGYLLSKKGKETNTLSNKAWKEVIWNIHFTHIPSKKERLIAGLLWYKGVLENKEEDSSIFPLIDCVIKILDSLNAKTD